ncbi:ATP-binding protein [Bdellovibrionota bacterium FG-1]
MVSRADLKKVIDDWNGWFERARVDLSPRQEVLTLPRKNALALIGVRRGGKTSYGVQIAKTLENVLYINFEDPAFYEDNSVGNLEELLSVYVEFNQRLPELVVFDEIQNIDGWERWVRKAVDMGQFGLILTGSSSKLLSSEISTSIAGRCIEKTVWPLSFGEFLKFSNNKASSQDEYLAAMRIFLQWGGFPEVVLTQDPQEKRDLLRQYMNDLILKDVISRNEIRNKRALDVVVAHYFRNISKLHSYTAIKKGYEISTETAGQYTGFLQDAFLLFEVSRFHANLKISSRDPKKIYAIDTGLRNAHTVSNSVDDFGKLAENAVYIELRRRKQDVYYWSKKQEVDFLTVENGAPVAAIQVCYSDMREPEVFERETGALLECLNDTGLDEGTVLTLSREESLTLGGKRIRLQPLYRWLMAGYFKI